MTGRFGEITRGRFLRRGAAAGLSLAAAGLVGTSPSHAQSGGTGGSTSAMVDLGQVSAALEDFRNLMRGAEGTVGEDTVSTYNDILRMAEDANDALDESADFPIEEGIRKWREIQHLFRHADNDIATALYQEEHHPDSGWHDIRTSALDVQNSFDFLLDAANVSAGTSGD